MLRSHNSPRASFAPTGYWDLLGFKCLADAGAWISSQLNRRRTKQNLIDIRAIQKKIATATNISGTLLNGRPGKNSKPCGYNDKAKTSPSVAIDSTKRSIGGIILQPFQITDW